MIAGWWVVVASAQPMTTNGYTFSPNRAVPDGNPTGLALATNLSGMTDFIANVTVSLNISGGFNGDLYAYLTGPTGGFAVLLNRVGVANGNANGYDDTGLNITLNDAAGFNNVHFYQDDTYTLNGGGQLTGNWSSDGRAVDPLSAPTVIGTNSPTALLDSFDGISPDGTWTLFVADLSNGEQSTVVTWGLTIVTVPEPATWALLGTGAALFLALRNWRVHFTARGSK